MPQPWSDDAIRHLVDATTCPRCRVDALHERHCLNCGADLRGEIADRLWAASTIAVEALHARNALLEQVPTTAVPAATPAAPTPVSESPAAPPRESASATVQSVLAIAGAGLFAVAAIVFTFFNPDLTDHVLRSAIVGAVTVVFLVGAWLLARRGLQFSAEAVGALGMVFIALDIYAISEVAPPSINLWVFVALGTLVSAVAMIAFASFARIRSWLLISIVGLVAVPAMLGYAGDTYWSTLWGHVGTAFAVLIAHELIRKLAFRFASPLRPEHITLLVVQIVATALAVVQLPYTDAPTSTQHWLSISATLAALAVVAVFAARHPARTFWSVAAGGFAIAALGGLPFALDLAEPEWYLTLVPAAVAVGILALAVMRSTGPVSRIPLYIGAFAVGGLALVPSTVVGVFLGISTMLQRRDILIPGTTLDEVAGISLVLGLTAITGALLIFGVLRRAPIATATGLWVGLLALVDLASWGALLPVTQVAIGTSAAVAVAAALRFVPAIRRQRLLFRLPAIVAAHLLLVVSAAISWSDRDLTIYGGVALIAALVLVAQTVPRGRFIHVGVGYAYGLVIFATAVDRIDYLPAIALLCLTSAIGSAGAVVATVVRRVPAASWYAVLIVTTVPFVLGVISVLSPDRDAWRALSTGAMFLLALTLLLTRRPGLNQILRAFAAGLLVPTLAVVVVTLASALLDQSGSPVALPVIAAIVAIVLASGALIRTGLVRNALAARDAGLARLFIEGSALLTGAIAVALALVLPAAGRDTAFLVLVILGLGAAAMSLWGERRYGWWIAFASFTGALWCVWSLAGVTVIEPYLLPPAISAAIIGAIVTVRGGRGIPLYATSLAVAVVPVVAILAATGSGDAPVEWRAYALLGGSVVLGLVGAFARGRFAPLRTPSLVLAIAAATAGPIQAVRFGLGLDPLPFASTELAVALVFGAAGALLSVAAARLLTHTSGGGAERLARSRWLYAPATASIAVASWPTIERFDPETIWALYLLGLAYLTLMVVIVVRARRGATTLPPAWFVFAIAFITHVVAWSSRELFRVDMYSITMGVMLIAAGVIAMRTDLGLRRTLNGWPLGFTGSWALLSPGIAVIFLASVVATASDPLTWRAILVMALALGSILVGAALKLAAPFFLGLVVLLLENIVVFAVQIGRGIESLPWWITLAVIGAVLLIIAVTYERRTGADTSVAARLRDLK